jgi:UDP-N-acetylmuramoylalanine-D-glutamate ligase
MAVKGQEIAEQVVPEAKEILLNFIKEHCNYHQKMN